ncbi:MULTISPECIES: DUF4398 domain-containing protein [unclassified Shewanella]|uniref:DUF4398 domain-containing protein n=1 Tax=Shewanella TaxID=22 RepID=UPI0021D854D9|nr:MULTISPECIES: DUF4398 domain-containing protein [unclassified Shewanella]MCU7997594.1 DUF4398 domain-containing protein [Shewanella sp. SM95]MCU8103776.1 DUF4398 domain-containing protein [Shewanella sp. SM101]
MNINKNQQPQQYSIGLQRAKHFLLAGCIATALVGCSSTPLTKTAEMERAEHTIARAEQARVGQYASNELAQARLKLQSASSALLNMDTVSADRYAIEASLEAELAQARAEVGTSQ